mgnify:CR=1 FL=1
MRDLFLWFQPAIKPVEEVRCHKIPFCGFNTQWFSSGKIEQFGRNASQFGSVECGHTL